MLNVKQIIEAWIISYKPSDEQRNLAELRGEICDKCDSKLPKNKLFNMPVCKECGCPIGKKIFTNEYNPCPLSKWDETDAEFFGKKKIKNTLL